MRGSGYGSRPRRAAWRAESVLMDHWTIEPYGPRAWLVRFGEELSAGVMVRALAVARAGNQSAARPARVHHGVRHGVARVWRCNCGGVCAGDRVCIAAGSVAIARALRKVLD